MNLTVYKGFDHTFLKNIREQPLVVGEIRTKTDVLQFDHTARKKLAKALLSLDEEDSVWITYEEYSLINKRIEDAIEEDGLKLTIFRNNLYPDYYPVQFSITADLAAEITRVINGDTNTNASEECQRYLSVYNTLSEIDGVYYGSFYNYECESIDEMPIQDLYPYNITVEDSKDIADYNVFINEDIDTYLRDLGRIIATMPKVIGLSSTGGEAAKRIQRSLQAYCKANGIRCSLSKKLSFRWAFFDKSGKIEAGDKNDREKQKKQRANGNIQYRRICAKESSAKKNRRSDRF